VVGSRSSNRVCGESLKTSCLRSRLLAGLCGHRVRGNARERPESARVLSVHPGFGEGRFSTTPYEPFEIIGAGQNRPLSLAERSARCGSGVALQTGIERPIFNAGLYEREAPRHYCAPIVQTVRVMVMASVAVIRKVALRAVVLD
jgi:hypothetical protein